MALLYVNIFEKHDRPNLMKESSWKGELLTRDKGCMLLVFANGLLSVEPSPYVSTWSQPPPVKGRVKKLPLFSSNLLLSLLLDHINKAPICEGKSLVNADSRIHWSILCGSANKLNLCSSWWQLGPADMWGHFLRGSRGKHFFICRVKGNIDQIIWWLSVRFRYTINFINLVLL